MLDVDLDETVFRHYLKVSSWGSTYVIILSHGPNIELLNNNKNKQRASTA